MKIDKQKKHDSICLKVAEELKKRNWETLTHKNYSNGLCGEIDVIGYKNNYCLYVEVKCTLNNKNERFAIRQLNRARDYCKYHKNKKLFTMIAYEKNNKIIYKMVYNDTIR